MFLLSILQYSSTVLHFLSILLQPPPTSRHTSNWHTVLRSRSRAILSFALISQSVCLIHSRQVFHFSILPTRSSIFLYYFWWKSLDRSQPSPKPSIILTLTRSAITDNFRSDNALHGYKKMSFEILYHPGRVPAQFLFSFHFGQILQMEEVLSKGNIHYIKMMLDVFECCW